MLHFILDSAIGVIFNFLAGLIMESRLFRLRRGNLRVFLAVIGVCTVAVPCSASETLQHSTQPRIVVLISTCTLSKSFLSPYNKRVTFTPHLGRLSRDGYLFTKHRTEAGSSGIAFASIFSGSQANHHGVFHHSSRILDEVLVVSEVFSNNGYESYFWDKHIMAGADLGYAQGVDPENVIQGALHGSDARFEDILKKVRRDSRAKAFVFTAFCDTHAPYFDGRSGFCKRFPAECREIEDLSEDRIDRYLAVFRQNRRRFQADLPGAAESFQMSAKDVDALSRLLTVLYRSSVEKLDQRIGSIIEAVRAAELLDETVIIFTADHGELMYDPNEYLQWCHGATLQAEVLDVPLKIWGPGRVPVNRAEYVTRSIDVLPTLAGISELELPAEIRPTGIDLSPAMRGEASAPSLKAFSHTGVIKLEHLRKHADELGRTLDYFAGAGIDEAWIALRENDIVLKYRHFGAGEWRFEAFDLAEDPTEDHDIFDPSNSMHQLMVEELMEYKSELAQAFRVWSGWRKEFREDLSEDELRRLSCPGYIQ